MLAVIKSNRILLTAAITLLTLAVFATAAYADDEPAVYDYSDPYELSEAILALYTKDFAQCDSTAPAPSTASDIITKLGGGWDSAYKAWAIVKSGDSKYLLLTATDISAIDVKDEDALKTYIPMLKVADGDCSEGFGLVKDSGKGYNVIDAKSYFDAAATALELSADCDDLDFLCRVLGEAVAIAKADTSVDISSGFISKHIDSTARLSKNGEYAGVNYYKLLRAIDSLCAGKYKSIGLSVGYDSVSWGVVNNGSNRVTAIYFANIGDNELNGFYARVLAGETVNIRVYRYANGSLTEGYAPLKQNEQYDDYTDYRDILVIDGDNFVKGDPAEGGLADEPAEEPVEPVEPEEDAEPASTPPPAPAVAATEPLTEIVEEAAPLAEPLIAAETHNIELAETEIVEQALPLADAPQTGDSSHALLWAMLLLAALAGIVYSVKLGRNEA